MKIAVIGSGISGLSAAWLLSHRHQVTVYEADDRLGGHANTVDVAGADGRLPIDTGFIVYNEHNYPNLTALYDHLGVRTEPTEMSFSFSKADGAYEYASAGFGGFFGQRSNLLTIGHWRVLRDLSRFFRTAQFQIAADPGTPSLGEFLSAHNYSTAFVDRHILPMGAAIWSASRSAMLDFPARTFIDFYANHGMLQFRQRPAWRTVAGGSRNSVDRLAENGGFEQLPGVAVRKVIRRPNQVLIVDERGATRPFDQAVIATHADQALALIDAPSGREQDLLSCFSYQTNQAVLHRDPRWMPKRRRLWSSWNYRMAGDGDGQSLCVTYWMNRLQPLDTDTNYFVTLNPSEPIHPKAVDAAISYRHPVFDSDAIDAKSLLWSLQGQRRTWFCGSYFGYGFHEDGIQSGLAVAEQLGGVRRPWRVAGESGRIFAEALIQAEAAE